MKTNNGQVEFDRIIVDADKQLITAAKSVQEDYIEVTYNETGETLEFSGVQSFWGKTKVLSGEAAKWAKFYGVDVAADKKRIFTVVEKSRLRTDIKDHLEEALKQFSYNVGAIKQLPYSEDYTLCLGGEGNFRYDIGKILPYKNMRKEKPIVFQDLKDKVFSQYKNKLDISNGYESDDKLGMYAAENQAHFRKTGKYKYLLAFVDKDLKQLWGPWINFDRTEDGIQWIDPLEACRYFCYQMLKGDKTVDNIQGLQDVAPESREKYGIRKGKGCGDVAAEAILAGCKTPQELLTRVVEEYKACYKEPVTFISDSDGVEYTYTWKEYMSENARLLWMLRNDNIEWDIFSDLLDKLGVEWQDDTLT